MKYTRQWLIDRFFSGDPLGYVFFSDRSGSGSEDVDAAVLRQGYASPFVVEAVEYKTVLHWVIAQKALLFKNYDLFRKIVVVDDVRELEGLGTQIHYFDQCKWDEFRFEIIKAGCIHKFNQHEDLLRFLRGTSPKVIAYTNQVDSLLGIGMSHDDNLIDNPYVWEGQNLLGFALMEARDFLADVGNFDYHPGGEMLPPWRLYPDVYPDDALWTMGDGKQYIVDHEAYLSSLSPRDKAIYKLNYPSWGDWMDYYNEDTSRNATS